MPTQSCGIPKWAKAMTSLDIACGNGHFARAIAKEVKEVLAFDFSDRLINLARRKTQGQGISNVTFEVLDATREQDLQKLSGAHFDVAVCNMSLMDISHLGPLSKAIAHVLKPEGKFIFSICHPCFNQPRTRFVRELEDQEGNMIETHSLHLFDYCTNLKTQVLAFAQQAQPHAYYHRSLASLLIPFFQAQMAIDGIVEPKFPDERNDINAFPWSQVKNIPPVWICRFKKAAGGT